MPSLETNYPNCETARPGPPRSAPLCACCGDTGRTAKPTQRTPAPMTKPTDQTSRPGVSRRQLLKATAGTAALLAAARLNFPAGDFAKGAGTEVKGATHGYIALRDAGPQR